MVYVARHGLGAAGASSSSAAVDAAAAKLTAFAKTAKDEAERCFAATFLRSDDDRSRADDVITTTARAAADARSKAATGQPMFVGDPGKAKSLVDAAASKAASLLPKIKDSANVAAVQAAASAAKAAIDAAAAAVKAAQRSASSSVSVSTPPPALLPETPASSSFPLSPVQIAAVVGIAVLLLLPPKK